MPDSLRRFATRSLAEWQELFRASPRPDERYLALQAIVALSSADAAIGWLLRALDDADSGVQAGAARRLAQWAVAAQRPGTDDEWTAVERRWTELLTHDDPDVRFEAAQGIMQRAPDDAAARTVLLEFLNDADTQPAMLAAILRSLIRGSATPPAGVVPWGSLLHHAQPDVREQAIRAVVAWGQGAPHLAAELITLLDDEEPFVREEAAAALGDLGIHTDAVRSALEGAAEDEDPLVAEAARRALQRLPT
jgi:HEAT repeat protein